MNVKDKFTELKQIVDHETKAKIEEAEKICLAKDKEDDLFEMNNSLKNKNAAKENTDELKAHGRCITHLLHMLVKALFATFDDEERNIIKYQIAGSHKKQHEVSHAVFMRKVQAEVLLISGAGRSGKPIATTHAATLMQIFSAWMVEHATKIDRELSAHLIGKAPQSELEKEIYLGDMGKKIVTLKVPHSFKSFLGSDNASIQDRNMYEKMKKLLKLQEAKQ
ncbi:MAG: hypothetical protein EZS28_016182 [Streblomastix strix]|uniref:Uncharacterized protein n=1 Tax=Streblomastix strix TaxID=222440 RepID=A0A5J4W1H5_9EUKA|nr:MAG: hypothetical protein EZS28_016182 [Streblomastix strix]